MLSEWGGWKLDGQQLLAPKKVRLSPAEARLLYLLMSNNSGWYHQIKLIGQLHIKQSDAQSLHLRQLVTTLRAAIGKQYIKNHRDHGYRLLHINAVELEQKSELAMMLEQLIAATKIAKRLLKEERTKS